MKKGKFKCMIWVFSVRNGCYVVGDAVLTLDRSILHCFTVNQSIVSHEMVLLEISSVDFGALVPSSLTTGLCF